ncbi:MAG: phosphoribosylanthranilate isomerase, partial [Clostridiales bacterium]|nr:phosphoribosylanthranilate isomerase [Candidatus Blautia equi]
EKALELKRLLSPSIQAVGVFVNEPVENVSDYLNRGIIDLAQLHGSEDDEYIQKLRSLSPGKEIIQAFKIASDEDILRTEKSTADYILLDSGLGSGKVFDWNLIKGIRRPFFLAGGLTIENVPEAIRDLHPYAVDISSGLETDKKKDPEKMRQFVQNVRSALYPFK